MMKAREVEAGRMEVIGVYPTLGFQTEFWLKDFFPMTSATPLPKVAWHYRNNFDFANQQTWLQNVATTLISCLTLSKTFDIFKPLFSHLLEKDSHIHFEEMCAVK